MYPIRVFGIRVPRKGTVKDHIEYALYNDSSDGAEPVTCIGTLDELSVHVAHTVFASDQDTAVLCVRQPEHAQNLFAFRAKPIVREFRTVTQPETIRLCDEEVRTFLEMFLNTLRSLVAGP